MGRSTKNQKKQEQERAVFEMFARDFELPAGAIVYGDKPDVIIDGTHKIGIEITDLYLADGDDPGGEQVQQRHRDAVLLRAQTLHREAGGRAIELHFAFDFEKPIRKIGPLAKATASHLDSTALSLTTTGAGRSLAAGQLSRLGGAPSLIATSLCRRRCLRRPAGRLRRN
ncbi:MAG: hypothetical protein P4L81_03710 [Candidatus Pacebacteria bacterium]|nr:hypothetical protein [Candidatus Paceibacterota bacterium]